MTERGAFAVKDFFIGVDDEDAENEATYQDVARRAGIPLPDVLRSTDGRILVPVDGSLVRVYGWVDTRNRESQMLLRLLGFSQMQHLKRLHVLHRVGRPVPRSTTPAFGPLSRAGRHRAA